jgi:hypothetical protein
VLSLVPSEHLSENELAAAAVAEQRDRFNPQQQFRVTWPAEPVVAMAYVDQLMRGEALSESLAVDLVAALDDSAAPLQDGTSDGELAARLESFSASLDKDSGDATTKKRQVALAETLNGIAARLR